MPTIERGNVAFLGGDGAGGGGIYTDAGRTLEKVIDLSDILVPGNPLLDLSMGPEALSGDPLAFFPEFYDSSKAIYVASFIPEPPTSALLRAALLALGLHLRGHRRGTSRRRRD